MTADWMTAERAAPPPRPYRNVVRHYLADIEALRQWQAKRRHDLDTAVEDDDTTQDVPM